MSEFFLYHYSVKRHAELKTKQQQGNVKVGERKAAEESRKLKNAPGNYYDSLSFFLEPLPVDRIAGVYGNRHEIWKSGLEVFEYVVSSKDLPANVIYTLVEQPWRRDLLEHLYKFRKWESLTDLEKKMLFEAFARYGFTLGERGTGIKNIAKVIKRYPINEALDHLIKKGLVKDSLTQYASYIPHLMIYVDSPVRIHSTTVKRVL